MTTSSFRCPGMTRFAILNPDGSPADADFHVPASQVVGGIGNANVLNFLPQITGTTGGAPANLDGLPTVGMATYNAVAIRETGHGLTAWVLELDTDDGTGTRSVVPLDHAPGTNARTWRQRL